MENLPAINPDSGLTPSSRDIRLNILRAETEELAIVIDRYNAEKCYRQICDEQDLEDAICRANRDLSDCRIDPVLRPYPDVRCRESEIRLPRCLDTFVNYTADVTGWPRFPVMLFTLAALSIAMCGRYRVKLNEHWSEAVVLYMFLCAPSGNRKSALLDILKRPHINFEEDLQKKYTEVQQQNTAIRKMVDYHKQTVLRKAIKVNIAKLDMNDIDGVNTLFKEFKDAAMNIESNYKEFSHQQLAMPKLFISGSSPQMLYKTMLEQGSGINIFEAEGNNLLHMVNTPQAKLDIFTKAFGFENEGYDTKRDGSLMIDKPFLNMAINTNPDVIRQLYANERAGRHGLTPRAMVYFADYIVPPREDNQRREEIYQSYCKKITIMLERNYTQDRFREIHDFELSPEAYSKLKYFERAEHRLSLFNTHDAPIHAYWRKQHGLAARLAAVLHAWQYDEPDGQPISVDNVDSAVEILYCLEPHIEYAFSPSGIQAYYVAQKIMDWIRRHHYNDFTNTDAARSTGEVNAKIFPALDMLEQHNVIRQIFLRNKRICVVHPRV